mmetsp:Transcript_25286/g.58568  ORF Transcript_25286/g.58568 Transcript_25286/m.58568 type:complete len:126 (+) Transcript_25286:52-429(+)
MGRMADALAKMRTPEVMAAKAEMMESILSLAPAPKPNAGKLTAQVFQEPFFKNLKGEGMIFKIPFWSDYHTKYFIGGKKGVGTGRPIVHACLLIGCVGYTLEYLSHLQYLGHGRKHAHADGEAAH